MAHEESFEGRGGSMKGGKCAENHGGCCEAGCVHIETEEGVDAGQASWGTFHRVICRGQSVHILIPRRGTREHDLSNDTDQIHVAETETKDRDGGRRGPDKHDCGANKGSSEMTQAVGEPSQQVESGTFVSG